MNLTLNLLIRKKSLLKISQIKIIIDRKRMKFYWDEIEFYLQSLVEQSQKIIHFKEIWKKACKALYYKLSYENFMENMNFYHFLCKESKSKKHLSFYKQKRRNYLC